MSQSNKIAKNTIFLYIRMLIVMAVSLYTSRVVLAALGASDYGIYNVVGGVVTMMVFLNSALGASTSRFLTYELGTGNKETLKKTFSATLNLHLCVALLVLVLGETIGLWFLYNKLVIPGDRIVAAFWVYQFSIITTMINFTQVPYSATLISHENMSVYAYVGLYEGFTNLGVVLLLAYSPIDKLVLYAALLMINRLAIQLFYRIYSKRRYEECCFGLVWDKPLYKKLMRYSGWDMFGGLSSVCQVQGINIIINIFFGPVVNAARAIAAQVQSAVGVFSSNFLMASRPQVIKRYASNDINGMFNLSFKSAKYAYFLMLAFVAPLCFELKTVLKLWLGPEIPDYTYSFTLITLITCLLSSIHNASLMPYHAIGKIKIGNIIGGSLMIVALPISYILYKFGCSPEAALLTILVTNGGQQFITWIIVHHYHNFSYMTLIARVYIPCFLVTLLTVFPSLLVIIFFPEGVTRFFFDVLLFEMVLTIVIWFIGIENMDREFIKRYIINYIRR